MLKSIQLDIITIIVQFICISIYKSRRESVLKFEMSSKFLICVISLPQQNEESDSALDTQTFCNEQEA